MRNEGLRIAEALAAEPAGVPLVTGGCGTGRTTACLAIRERLGATRAQYVDLERVATTPERFLHALVAHSPFVTATGDLPEPPATPRHAVDEALKYLATARTRDGQPATFLLDEVLEFRTFESFPGLRGVLAEFAHALDDSPNRFVLTTRYATRGERLARDTGSRRLKPWPTPPLSRDAIQRDCAAAGPFGGNDRPADAETAGLVHALTEGRPMYVGAVVQQMKAAGDADPIGALTALLVPGGRLDAECRYRYEMRLQRARGYGALRAILAVLGEEEPLTLTPISQRLQRTPGSTKDYLTWLADVDLVRVDRKRYAFADPLLRVWVRLHGRPMAPDAEQVASEVQRYAVERLSAPPAAPRTPPSTPPPAASPEPAASRRGRPSWGEMEID